MMIDVFQMMDHFEGRKGLFSRFFSQQKRFLSISFSLFVTVMRGRFWTMTTLRWPRGLNPMMRDLLLSLPDWVAHCWPVRLGTVLAKSPTITCTFLPLAVWRQHFPKKTLL